MTPTAKSPYADYRFPGEVITHAVWLYFRFPLSLRMVEEMLAARGIDVSHETVRQWGRKFGQAFAKQGSMRKCGALTWLWRDGHRPDCRWLTPDTSVRTGAGASRRGSGCGSATAGARRVGSTASAASWQTACSPQH